MPLRSNIDAHDTIGNGDRQQCSGVSSTTGINLIVVTGPTAGGKTALAARLADLVNGEIISADSRQVYRKMDLGTGKDYDDYLVEGRPIPYHLIDIRDPGYKYNVFEFQHDFLTAYRKIREKDKMPLLAGGTGLYIQAVLEAYELTAVPVDRQLRKQLEGKSQAELESMLRSLNPALHNTTDTVHRKRTIRAIEIARYQRDHTTLGSNTLQLNPVILGIKHDRPLQRKKISERLEARLKEGLIDEVRRLLRQVSEGDLMYYGLEYKFITQFLHGKLSYEEMHKKLETAIHQFAKRQMTWFRKMERQGFRIHWIDAALPMREKIDQAKIILEAHGLSTQTH